MIQVIVGHRGVGKSSLGKRIQNYFPEMQVLDLDAEMAQQEGQSVSEIFQQKGEAYFRGLELRCFQQIYQQLSQKNQKSYLIVGGGFPVDKIPQEAKILFVSRSTDRQGRIFLDRPRLNSFLTPLDEFHERYVPRQDQFQKHHDFFYQIPEGMLEYFYTQEKKSSLLFAIERTLLKDSFQTKFGYTIQAHDFENPRGMNTLLRWVEKNQIGFLELRDDLLSQEQIQNVLQRVRNQKILLSLRALDSAVHAQSLVEKYSQSIWGIDCDFQYVQKNLFKWSVHLPLKIISSHQNHIPSFDLPSGWKLKWSPFLPAWQDLNATFSWVMDNPQVIFLPRSADGRWSWIRLLLSARQPLNFMQMSSSSALDQPSLFECLLQQEISFHGSLAGVMGEPVQHSHSLVFHADYFLQKQMPYFRFAVPESEWMSAMKFWEQNKRNLQLQAASVTAPLKKNAAALADNHSPYASCNTLVKDSDEKWHGHNTDDFGFFEAFKNHLKGHILMWGGGGTIEVIQTMCQRAGALSFQQMSSRKPQDEGFDFSKEYILVWAAPSLEETQYPAKEMQISCILDLNYFENSYGRNLALARKIPYISGHEMFRLQAEQQQKIWSQS